MKATNEPRPGAKLSRADYVRARKLRRKGWLLKDIASLFGVAPSWISHVTRKTRSLTGHGSYTVGY